ncbi:MAG TPA: hypothetical protein VGG45_12295 [Terracidiphilus sp.]|jgi:hypothetical protein
MAIIVVGGGGRGAGKTALVCGLMRAMPKIAWIAVKITSHEHGKASAIWEETTPGQETDTARYLAAGARRALLVTAGVGTAGTSGAELGPIVEKILRELPPGSGVIFESNSVLRHVRPDVCLCAAMSPWAELKPSHELLLANADAMVELAGHDHIIEAEKITFRLASLERVSPVMLDWVRERLAAPR